MKNNYSLAERNRIVEEYLPYVDQVIRRNKALIRAARLEYDDVYHGAAVQVRQYRFFVKGPDWLAERDSFALIKAYDELALRHGEKPFVKRGDVKLLEQYEISMNLCGLYAHRGLLTMADVGCCNCCDAGAFFDPEPHAGEEAAEG